MRYFMNDREKFDNIISSITVRLDQLVNYSRMSATDELTIDKGKKNIPIFKYLFNLLITLFFIVPTTFQINNVLNAQNSKTEYKIHGIYDGHTKKRLVDWDDSHTPEQIFQYSIRINGTMNISKGQVKKVYIIYSKFEGDKIIETDFYPLQIKEKHASAFTYILKSLPYFDFSETPLMTDDFTQLISYHSAKESTTKPIYILSIDNQNNIDISVLIVRAKADTINRLTDRKLNLGSTEMIGSQPKTKLNFKTSEQILDSQNSDSKTKLNISVKQFKNDTSEIQTIFRQYFRAS